MCKQLKKEAIMFFNRSSDGESYEYQKQREEHERQQQLNLARGTGSFLYRYVLYTLIYVNVYISLSMTLNHIIGLDFATSSFTAVALAFFIFKIPYVKQHPVQSLLTTVFIVILVMVAFS